MGEDAPWRRLESGTAPGGAPTERNSQPGLALDPRHVVTIAGFVVAAILGVVALILVLGAGHGTVLVDGAVAGASPSGSDGPVAERSGRVVVDVQGAVVRPGIVELAPGSRVGDAITAAGGFGPRVAGDRVGQALNLAAIVHDGDQILVPSRDDPADGNGPAPSAGGPVGGLVELNHATAAELDALPGVGPATAAKIIAAREEQPFASVDDLQTRKIVGAATFEKLKSLVVVR
ncbi:MAG TPA: ComEA family DNA-binding protein [Candidatus Limnocylindrales bacterium]|nr:ComEA family DNA-binding protein [Candidatus Limnocylindrales bacterium]